MTSVNTLNNIVGAVTEHVTNNIFGDKPFDGQKFGGSLMNGLLQSFQGGMLGPVAGSVLNELGGWVLDPSKNIYEKWQVNSLVDVLYNHTQRI